jgi:hypothetical protein
MLVPAFIVAGAMTYLYVQMKDLREQPHGAVEKRHTERPTSIVARAPAPGNYDTRMETLPAVHGAPFRSRPPAHTPSSLSHPELPLRFMGKQRLNEHAMPALDPDALLAWQAKNADRKQFEHYNPNVVQWGSGSAANQRYRVGMQTLMNPAHPSTPLQAGGLVAVY